VKFLVSLTPAIPHPKIAEILSILCGALAGGRNREPGKREPAQPGCGQQLFNLIGLSPIQGKNGLSLKRGGTP
jgi:hypothetical protein